MTAPVVLHTDGACHPNPGYGGWAYILRWGEYRKEVAGGEALTTSNRMETLAVIYGLEELQRPCVVEVVTDSQYLIKGITEWIHGWRKRNWTNSKGEDVVNLDLWERLDALCARHQVTWTWIRGHSGHPENERCDQLAVAERCKLSGASPADEAQAKRDAIKRNVQAKRAREAGMMAPARN